MSSSSSPCKICGRKVEMLRECILCGKSVCASCYRPMMGLCKDCAPGIG